MHNEPTTAAGNVISVERLSKSYGSGANQSPVLREVSLSVAQGEFVAIMGASGSGKSTLLNVLGLLDAYDSGRYLLSGQDTQHLSDADAARLRNRTIGFVFQSFHLLAQKSAWENVALPLSYRRVPRQEQRARAHAMLESLKLSHRADHRPNELSGGQRQRVAIARALITDPALVLADEPTGNLDTETSAEVMALLHEIHAQGRTIVLVTHEPTIAASAQRIIYVRDGRVESAQARQVEA